MPYIHTQLNVRLSEEKESILKARLGEAIAEFPGKSEYWLMLRFTDSCRMWFRGYQNFPVAMVEVQLFGSPDRDACDRMTKQICTIFHDVLDIAPDHVYVNYSFTDTWGWNNENF